MAVEILHHPRRTAADDEVFYVELVRVETSAATEKSAGGTLRVRFHIIRNARMENVGKSRSCMVSKLRMICKQTVVRTVAGGGSSIRVGATDASV